MPDAERSPHTHGVAASFFCVTSSNGLLFPGSMFFECYGRRVNSPLAGRDLDRLFGGRRFEPDPPHLVSLWVPEDEPPVDSSVGARTVTWN